MTAQAICGEIYGNCMSSSGSRGGAPARQCKRNYGACLEDAGQDFMRCEITGKWEGLERG